MNKKLEDRLKKQCKDLNELLEEAKAKWPDAEFYLTPGYLHLLSGPSHDSDCRSHQERIIATAKIEASGGDW